MLSCQFTTKRLAHRVDIPVIQSAGGIGEVNILEDTERLARHAYQYLRMHPLLIDSDEFSRLNFADEASSKTVQGTRLRGDDPVFADAPQAEGPHAPGVTHGKQLAFRQDDEAIGSSQLGKDGDHALAQAGAARVQE